MNMDPILEVEEGPHLYPKWDWCKRKSSFEFGTSSGSKKHNSFSAAMRPIIPH